MRASALSDDTLIKTVNEFCVPVSLNITRDGFPVDLLPAMKPVELIYNSSWRNEFGFASCLMIDPEGKVLLGSSAMVDNAIQRLDPQQFFDSERYLAFIVKSLERYNKLKKIRQLPPLLQIGGWTQLMNEIREDIQTSVQAMLSFQSSFSR